jgi:hypothetical protein
MTPSQRDREEHGKARQPGGKTPFSGGRKPPQDEAQQDGIRSLLLSPSKNWMADAANALQDAETGAEYIVQLRRLVSDKEKNYKIKWRAAKLYATHSIGHKEWYKVRRLLSSQDEAIKRGAMSALTDAAKDGVHNLDNIKSLIEEYTGNGHSHSMGAAQAVLATIRNGEDST